MLKLKAIAPVEMGVDMTSGGKARESSIAEAQCRISCASQCMHSLLLLKAASECLQSSWSAARETCRQAKSILSELPEESEWYALYLYLQGAVEQAEGHTAAATESYEALVQTYTKFGVSAQHQGVMSDDLVNLAKLNLLILRRIPSRKPSVHDQEMLVQMDKSLPSSHPNQAVRLSFELVRLLCNGARHEFLKNWASTRQSLMKKLKTQFLFCLCFNAILDSNRGITDGHNASNFRRFCFDFAVRHRNPLWIAVSAGVLADLAEKAAGAKVDLDNAMENVNEGVRKIFEVRSEDEMLVDI